MTLKISQENVPSSLASSDVVSSFVKEIQAQTLRSQISFVVLTVIALFGGWLAGAIVDFNFRSVVENSVALSIVLWLARISSALSIFLILHALLRYHSYSAVATTLMKSIVRENLTDEENQWFEKQILQFQNALSDSLWSSTEGFRFGVFLVMAGIFTTLILALIDTYFPVNTNPTLIIQVIIGSFVLVVGTAIMTGPSDELINRAYKLKTEEKYTLSDNPKETIFSYNPNILGVSCVGAVCVTLVCSLVFCLASNSMQTKAKSRALTLEVQETIKRTLVNLNDSPKPEEQLHLLATLKSTQYASEHLMWAVYRPGFNGDSPRIASFEEFDGRDRCVTLPGEMRLCSDLPPEVTKNLKDYLEENKAIAIRLLSDKQPFRLKDNEKPPTLEEIGISDSKTKN